MNTTDYEYNFIAENVIYIKRELKIKGKEYGIAALNKKHIKALAETIDLISVTPSLSPTFSIRIEKFLSPRFNEVIGILFTMKDLPDDLGIEISKENCDDIIKGLKLTNVALDLKKRGYTAEELRTLLKKIQFSKYK